MHVTAIYLEKYIDLARSIRTARVDDVEEDDSPDELEEDDSPDELEEDDSSVKSSLSDGSDDSANGYSTL